MIDVGLNGGLMNREQV